MTELTHTTLGDLVAQNPAAARTLDRFRLDYCCHGERTLGAACADAGLDATEIEAELLRLDVGGDTSWRQLAPDALADHIVATHHTYLHDELPLLDELAAKVLTVHGDRHPELRDLYHAFAELRADLEPHLDKEERILFPAIHALIRGEREFGFGSVEDPIGVMGEEHERAGELFAELRALTGDYSVPDDGCASYRSLYERLDALEADTHMHILKENHTLFPAAIALAGASA